jgi:type IV pilus assembly protein PilC
MPIFNYKARDSAGKAVSGSMEAATRSDLIDKLQKLGFMATAVKEARGGSQAHTILDRFARVGSGDLLMFYIELSNMISAGLPILTCLNTLHKQIENKRLKAAVGNVARQVESGGSLSQGFASESRIFHRLFVNMIKAGEASGSLDTVLMKYAEFFEKQEDLKQKVAGALFYPIILLCAGITVSLFIVTFVIPQFAEIYMKAGIKLPIPTLVVYKAGIALKHYWLGILIALIALFIGIKLLARTPRAAFLLDSLKLRLPIIGPLYRKVIITRFTRTFATLFGSGVPILESLDITKEVAGNEVIARVIDNVRKCVERGEKISEPMKISEEFPPDVVQMISVGEETGALDTMLNKTADFYDMTVNYAVRKLTTIIEPVFLVIMGIMVGSILASMLLPIFDMVKTLRH